MISFNVNGRRYELDLPVDTPLLWVVRENLRLTGTKYGCGKALCGACTVHVNDKAIRSCVTPVLSVMGKEVTTLTCEYRAAAATCEGMRTPILM